MRPGVGRRLASSYFVSAVKERLLENKKKNLS